MPTRDPREWDAASYDTLPMPHVQWGVRTLERLPLSGDETVLELGCGTGRDTARLIDKLPSGRVIALDGSAAMVQRTRENCGDRAETLQADLRQPLPLPDASVDAVFSVATLHWVPDHAAVFRELFRVLKPGGRLALDYGGPGNVAEFIAALAALGREVNEVDFPSQAEEEEALRGAGFVDVDVHVRTEEPFHAGRHMGRFLETICLNAQVAGMPQDERRELVQAVLERMPPEGVTYVRTEVTARRP